MTKSPAAARLYGRQRRRMARAVLSFSGTSVASQMLRLRSSRRAEKQQKVNAPPFVVILSGAKDPCEGTEQSDPCPDCRKNHCRSAAGAVRARNVAYASSTAHARSSGRRSPFPLGGRHPVAGAVERSRGKAQSRSIAALRQRLCGQDLSLFVRSRPAWQAAKILRFAQNDRLARRR